MKFIITTIKAIAITIIMIITLIVILAIAAPSPEETLKGIQTDVATDFERQYYAAVSHGTLIDRCVRAGLVAEGYLQSGDDAAYAKWKGIEREDCKSAGVPR